MLSMTALSTTLSPRSLVSALLTAAAPARGLSSAAAAATTATTATTAASPFLASPAEAAALAKQEPGYNAVIVDVSGDREAHARAHVAGAYWLPVAPTLKGHGSPHVLPPAAFATLLQSLGINANSHVILYDQAGGMAAARVWWVFQLYGVHNARVMDGGWRAYTARRLPTSGGMALPLASHAPPAVSPQPSLIATLPDVLAASAQWAAGTADAATPLLLDVRSEEEFSGEDAHGNARSGHAPGALNLPHHLLMNSTGGLKSADELRATLLAAGVTDPARPVVTMCQSGMRASLAALALKIAGWQSVANYDASMGEYLAQRDAPLA